MHVHAQVSHHIFRHFLHLSFSKLIIFVFFFLVGNAAVSPSNNRIKNTVTPKETPKRGRPKLNTAPVAAQRSTADKLPLPARRNQRSSSGKLFYFFFHHFPIF